MTNKLLASSLILLLFFGLWNIESKAADIQLPVNAKAYILIDPVSGRILLQKNSEEKRAMASTTKIMTAIVALEKGDLQSEVKVSPRASSVGGSSFYLKAGEVLSLENMLYGLLLPSGNDVAVAIAEHIGGTEENFVKMMNKKAVELGALNTNFKNPHGLDDPNHYTCAQDLALIARYAWNFNKFREIVQTKTKEIKDGNISRQILSTNRLLWEFEGTNGIKTGYTGKAGKCLVASVIKNDFQLMSIVLGTNYHFRDSIVLLNYGFNNYLITSLIERDRHLLAVSVQNGFPDEVSLIVKENISLPLMKNELFRFNPIVPNKVKAPVTKGDQIGQLEVIIGNSPVYSTPLVAMNDVRVETYSDILYKILEFWLTNKFENNLLKN